MTRYKVNTNPADGFILSFIASLSNKAYQIEVRERENGINEVSFFATEHDYSRIMSEFQPNTREKNKINRAIVYSIR